MTVENPPTAATVRFQTSGHFVQALDGSGNPQTLADAVADGLGGGSAKTPHTVSLGASASQVIPSGAKGWAVTILTGTATIGAATALPAGFSASDASTLATTLTVTTDSASSAFVYWTT